ncbi:MAG: hypothetical protein OEL20_05045 [Sulfuritalea sp.]|nr:hypothetical protein [Sulfuritalea sp.]
MAAIAKIIYPQAGKRTRLDDGPGFQGRNGIGIQTGVEVYRDVQRGVVRLTPISSKGELANCYLEIPEAQFGQLHQERTDTPHGDPAIRLT